MKDFHQYNRKHALMLLAALVLMSLLGLVTA